MSNQSPIIMWFRRDLRLSDHEALSAAVATGRPVIPLFINDEIVESHGAAPKWRLGLSVENFTQRLGALGSRLILRRGHALDVLNDVLRETGAGAVYWSRAYDTDTMARDTDVKAALKDAGIEAESFQGHVLFEPWRVANKSGGYFKVYTPFWRCVSQNHNVDAALPAVGELRAPVAWPASDNLSEWALGAGMVRGGDIVAKHVCVGEIAAFDRLDTFLQKSVNAYKEERDFPSIEATSRLSENLTYGEISPRSIWHAGQAALSEGARGAEHFLKELVWREYAYHLMFHFPALATDNWRPEWANFKWLDDNDNAQKWRMGMTGEQMVDAGMRELYVTGTMHNRVRMIVASYLTKHLRTDWRVGLKWFEDCLIDWDPAANAMGWQWVAGCGPDASPYFRVFNPATQGEKFDKNSDYRTQFLTPAHSNDARDFFNAIPRSWGLDPDTSLLLPIVSLADGRAKALAAYSAFKALQDEN